MKTTSLQLPDEVKGHLETRARELGVSKSKLAREYIERGLGESAEISCLDRMGEWVGHFYGPKTLSKQKAFE